MDILKQNKTGNDQNIFTWNENKSRRLVTSKFAAIGPAIRYMREAIAYQTDLFVKREDNNLASEIFA